MDNQIQWWQSRTIWTGLIGTLFAVLSGFGLVPEGLNQDMVLEAVLGVVSVAAILFRVKATKAIVTPAAE